MTPIELYLMDKRAGIMRKQAVMPMRPEGWSPGPGGIEENPNGRKWTPPPGAIVENPRQTGGGVLDRLKRILLPTPGGYSDPVLQSLPGRQIDPRRTDLMAAIGRIGKPISSMNHTLHNIRTMAGV